MAQSSNVMRHEPCSRCGNKIMPARMGIGNGITVQECCICGSQNYRFPDCMQKNESPSRTCEFPGCEDAVDTEYGHYCRDHRVYIRKEGQRTSKAVLRRIAEDIE